MVKTKDKKRQANQISWAQACRDIGVASMNKGQFPLFVFAIIILSLIWKMPPDDVSKLVNSLIFMLQNGELVGYVLATFTTGGWFVHAKWQRRIISREIQRLSDERNKAQSNKVGEGLIKTSKGPQ